MKTPISEEEDLQSLIKLEPKVLLEKFKNIIRAAATDENEEVLDIKAKLRFQINQREIYEKQLEEIRFALNISKENHFLDDILTEIKNLQESTGNGHEQIETTNYANAQEVLDNSL